MNRRLPIRPSRNCEDGYVLVAVIFMMAILILSLSVAVPKVREAIQSDRDEETLERGKQYIRAIQLYYRKFHAYPPNVDALVKTNEIRFLRKKYIDPTTGKDEWKPIMWGQNKTPIAMGFFGQPLAAAAGGGIGPSGGNLTGPGSATGGGLFGPPSGASGLNPSTPGAGTGDQSSGTDASGNPASGAPSTGSSSPSSSPGSTTASSSNPTGNGQTFGGAGIIGFSPQSPKQSIYVYKKKNHYIDWEFLYSPLMDQPQIAGGNTNALGQPQGTGQAPAGGSGTPTGTPPPTPNSQQ